MKNKLLIFLFFCAFQSLTFAQLNEYKYIVVPKKFDAFRTENEFQSSTLIKYLLQNEGFNAIYDDAMPDDLIRNRCLGLRAKVVDESSLLWTKTIVQLLDCRGEVVLESIKGKSKEKEFQKGYTEALKESCSSFKGLNYQYVPKEAVNSNEPLIISFKDDVKTLDDANENAEINQGVRIDPKSVHRDDATKANENESPATIEPIFVDESEILYAQPTESGLDLLDSDSRLKYVLEESSVKDVYLLNYEGTNAMVFKKDTKWFIEYKDTSGKVVKELQIKF